MGSFEEGPGILNYRPVEKLLRTTSKVELEGFWECEQHLEDEMKPASTT